MPEKDSEAMSALPPENPYPVLSIARSGQVIYANTAAHVMMKNWKTSDGQTTLEFCKQLVNETMSSGEKTRIVEVNYNDRTISLAGILNEDQNSLDLFGTDITERKAAEEKVRFAANHDILTKLPNAQLLLSLLEKKLRRAKKNRQISAFLFVDINNFKQINDTFGRESGDLVLLETAKRLAKNSSHVDTVARVGADEFGVIIRNVNQEGDVVEIVKKILRTNNAPIHIRRGSISVFETIGIALYPEHAHSSGTLTAKAEAAMREARNRSRPFQIFDEKMEAEATERITLAKDLTSASDNHEFQVYYQPIVNTQTDQLVAIEALVRWNHPEKGLLPPDMFLAIAEDTGYIEPMGAWVLREACRQIATWRRDHPESLKHIAISINLSVRQLYAYDVPQLVNKILDDTGLEPTLLELEITETLLMQGHDHIREVLSDLKKKGVLLAIDDFGTGYSSLAYLKNFPIDVLKIDKSFTDSLEMGLRNTNIMGDIISLAHHLDLKVVAEGVETKEQQKILRKLDCDSLQGYLFAKPAPADVFYKHYLQKNGGHEEAA